MVLSSVYPTHTFSLFHILYIIISIALIVGSMILIKKYVKKEKTLMIIYIMASILTLVFVTINRIGETIYDTANDENATWTMILPHSICSFCSLVIPIAFLINRKDNFVVHSLYACGFLGGLSNIIYPDPLNNGYIYELRIWSSLAHHFCLLWLLSCLLVTGVIKPAMRKMYYWPLAACVVTTFGVFELDVLKLTKAMNIGRPLLSDVPVLTDWYMLYIGIFIAEFIFTFLYEKLHDKKSVKEIFTFKKNNCEQ